MIECREHLGLTAEPRNPCGISRHVCRQDLDGNLAAEHGVGGAIDLAHSAFAQLGGDAVMRERLTDHVCIILARLQAEARPTKPDQPAVRFRISMFNRLIF